MVGCYGRSVVLHINRYVLFDLVIQYLPNCYRGLHWRR
jgi:hypothetical protein